MIRNEAQERIIQFDNGQMIVVACPGSGKTTTMIRRIRRLEDEKHVDPQNILMITFTKAAARSMKKKYEELFGKEPEGTFCTIHSLCLSILNRFSDIRGADIVKDPEEYIFPVIKYNNVIRDKGKFLREALTDISVMKNAQITLNEYTPECCEDKKLFIKIFSTYEKALKDNGQLDFDDLLFKTYELLKKNKEALKWVRSQYRYIHVDEYQDINGLQRDIIYLVAGKDGNLVVVGDDDQSIYGFRGADPEIMLNFTKDYPRSVMVHMSTNYRSDKSIIVKADSLIRTNRVRFPKKFEANSDKEGITDHFSCSDPIAEMNTVADDIRYCLDECGVSANDIAVLYRVNAQSGMVAEALHEKGIKFYSNETIESRYSNWMFYDICAYFRTALGIGDRKDFSKTIEHPKRWMSGIDLEKTGMDAGNMKRALCSRVSADWQKERAASEVNKYVALMHALSECEIWDALRVLLLSGGYLKYITEYAEFRQESEEELLNTIEAYFNDIRKWNVKTFQEWYSHSCAYNSVFENAQRNKSGVCLSTLHKAKGLEWNIVFMVGCNEGNMPYVKEGKKTNVEEERRLFYVGMTRAKHELYLYSHEARRGSGTPESRFITEAGIVPGENTSFGSV